MPTQDSDTQGHVVATSIALGFALGAITAASALGAATALVALVALVATAMVVQLVLVTKAPSDDPVVD